MIHQQIKRIIYFNSKNFQFEIFIIRFIQFVKC